MAAPLGPPPSRATTWTFPSAVTRDSVRRSISTSTMEPSGIATGPSGKRRPEAICVNAALNVVMAPLLSSGSTAAGHDAAGQGFHVGIDLARAREPYPLAVLDDVLEGAAQTPDAIGPTHHERVERDRAHERLARRLREHLVELIHDHVREFCRGVPVP